MDNDKWPKTWLFHATSWNLFLKSPNSQFSEFMIHKSVQGFSDHSPSSTESAEGGISKMCTCGSAKVHSLRPSRYLLGVHGRMFISVDKGWIAKCEVQVLLSLWPDWDKLVCGLWGCSDVACLIYPEATKQSRRGVGGLPGSVKRGTFPGLRGARIKVSPESSSGAILTTAWAEC